MSIDKKQAQVPPIRKYNEMLDEDGLPSEENIQGQGSQTKYVRNADALQFSNTGGANALTTQANANNEKEGFTFDPNQTQTNALLDVKDKKFDLLLQQAYYSPNCQYFYISLLIFAFILILITVIDGFKVAQTAWFILFEFILNTLIGLDLVFRIKMAGFHKYFVKHDGRKNWWSIFDAFVVIGCIVFFIITLIHQNDSVQDVEEVSEEVLLVTWSVWQTMRMIIIVKKQRQAQQSAKTLIDFTNIMVETDFGMQSHRGAHDEIIFEMNNKSGASGNKDKSSDEYRYANNGSKTRQRKRSVSGSSTDDKQTNEDGGIELSDLSNPKSKTVYQIDDEIEPSDVQKQDKDVSIEREIVFDPDEI